MQPRDFSIYGAVDLGARQQAAQRQQRAAQATPDGDGDGAVIDVTEETFNTEVMDRSLSTPVIVEFWAEQSAASQQLGSVLQKLAAESAGQWALARVDVNTSPRLAQAVQIQGVPAAVAVIGGQLLELFQGAPTEQQLRQVIAQVLAAAEQYGTRPPGPGAGADQPPGPEDEAGWGPGASNPAYAEVQQAMQRGDMDAAAKTLGEILKQSPADPVAKMALAQVDLFRRLDSSDEASSRQQAAQDPSDLEAQMRVADFDVAAGLPDQAFDRLLGVVRRTAGEERDRARIHLVSLFEMFPPQDPRVKKARTDLSTLLF
jgi:putative thioredoxin